MRLPDFTLDDGLNRLRRTMGADLVEWTSGSWEPRVATDLLDLLSRQEGVDLGTDVALLRTNEDGTFSYEGFRVLVYIRDQWYYPDNPDQEYKYHLGRCRTIEKMFGSGRRDRYVVTTNTMGEFLVHLRDRSTERVRFEGNKTMRVCKNCLSHLDYGDYNSLPTQGKLAVYESFSIAAFFEAYGGVRIDRADLPAYDEYSSPANVYPKDWHEVSTRYRRGVGWTCENCGVSFKLRDVAWLHVHHKNHQRSDTRDENLVALCVGCHAEQPDHAGLKHGPEYRSFRRAHPTWAPPMGRRW